MKTVYTTTDNFKAQLAAGILRDGDVECRVLNENINNLMPYASAISEMQVSVAVADCDCDLAIEMLTAHGYYETRLNNCTHCGGSDITLSLRGKHSVKRIFVAILALLTISSPGRITSNYYCNTCKQEF